MFGAEGVKLQFNIHVHDGRVRPKEEGSVCVCVCVCVCKGWGGVGMRNSSLFGNELSWVLEFQRCINWSSTSKLTEVCLFVIQIPDDIS